MSLPAGTSELKIDFRKCLVWEIREHTDTQTKSKCIDRYMTFMQTQTHTIPTQYVNAFQKTGLHLKCLQ